MRLTAIVTAALLGGCVHTSTEVLEIGYRSTHHSALSAQAFARCIVENVEVARAFTPQREPIAGGVELVIRYNGSTSVIAIAQVKEEDSGSAATLWIAPSAPLSHAGCA